MLSKGNSLKFSKDCVLCFEVNEPTIHDKGYTVYKVTLKEISADQKSEQVVVWRRFNDFKKLYTCMLKLHTALHRQETFPPFIRGQVFGRYEDAVVIERQRTAQDLLNFVGHRKYLVNSQAFQEFFKDGVRTCDTSSNQASTSISSNSFGLDSLDSTVMQSTPDAATQRSHSRVDEESLLFRADKRLSHMAVNLRRFLGHSVGGAEGPSNLEGLKGDYIYQAAHQMSLAQQCEASGNYQMAFTYYRSGVGILLTGVQFDDNSRRIALVRKKTARYLQRAEDLQRQHLDQNNCRLWKTPSSLLPPHIACLQGSLSELSQLKVLGIVGDKLQLVLDSSQSGTPFILKVLHKSLRTSHATIIPLDCPFMVPLCRFYESDDCVFLLLRLADGERLRNYVKGCNRKMKECGADNNVPQTTAECSASRDLRGPRCGQLPSVVLNNVLSYSLDCPEHLQTSQSDACLSSRSIKKNWSSNDLCPTDASSNHLFLTESGVHGPRRVESDLSLDFELASTSSVSSLGVEHAETGAETGLGIEIGIETSVGPETSPETILFSEAVPEPALGPEEDLKTAIGPETGAETSETTLGTETYLGLASKPGAVEAVRDDEDTQKMQVFSVSMSTNMTLDEDKVRVWAAEIIIALDFIHRTGLIWRDFHADNVLIGGDGHVTLTLCTEWSSVERSLAEIDWLIAPELRHGRRRSRATPSCDYWSLGVVLFELLTGQMLSACCPSDITSHSVIVLPSSVSDEAASLITSLLKYNPEERLGSGSLGSEDLKTHPFFKDIDWKGLERCRH